MYRTFLLSSVAALVVTTADASHFRGATLIPSVDASGNLTVQATSYWRPTFVASGLNPTFGTLDFWRR